MARTNEHYLPQFLMRRFASLVKRNEAKTWWFRKDSKPHETNIRNIAAEKDFHASSTGISADDSVKPLEDRFAWYQGSLRRQRRESLLEDAIIPELVANLTVRTKAFRDGMTGLMMAAMGEV